MMNTNTTNTTANQQAAQEAEGFMARIKKAMNTVIGGACETVSDITGGIEDISSLSGDDAEMVLNKSLESLADSCRNIAGVLKRIPSQADSIEVHNFEDAEKTFRAAAEDIKNHKGFGAKAKTVCRLVLTALCFIGKKCAQFALKAAKKILVTGIRIFAVGASFIIRIITGTVKAAKKTGRFLKAWKQAKKDNKVRQEAGFTVDDLEDYDFEEDEVVIE